MRFKLIVPALVAATALALTGCVNNGGGGNTNTPAPTIAPDAAAVALLPEAIKASGELSMGVDATYPPNEYKDAAGNPIGWDIELANAVAAKLVYRLRCQANVTADRNAAADQESDGRRHFLPTFQLDHLCARCHQRDGVAESLFR